MKLIIEKSIFENFPGLNIGIVIARHINNSGENPEVADILKFGQERIRSVYTTDKLSEEPKIFSWRDAYRSFGAKPKKQKSSVESLYRMVIEGINLRHINNIVDIYNYISLKHMIPVGGDDIDHVDGNIVLRYATGSENFIALNTSEVMNPKSGEVIYADDIEVLCRRWNWRECDKTKMTENSKNVSLVAEGLPPFTDEEINGIILELADLVQKYCGGETETFVLNEGKREVEF